MEKENLFTCVACCSANGELRMERNALDAFVWELKDSLIELDGERRYNSLLSFADFCIEQKLDSEAMSCCLEVFDNVMGDKRLRLGKKKREWFRIRAFERLKSLCFSNEEVVWEICSQLTSDYLYLHPDW